MHKTLLVIIALAGLVACGSVEEPTTASDAPPTIPEGATVTLVGVDQDGKVISQQADSTALNRIVRSKWAKMKAYQRGEPETTQQAVGVVFQGNAGSGCTGWGCPSSPYAVCLDSDTWLYNMHNGWSAWDWPLIIGCFRGTAWSTQYMNEIWVLASGQAGNNLNTWAYQPMSVWAGDHRVGFNASSDAWVAAGYCVTSQQGCTVDPNMRQVAAWAQRDWGTIWNNPPPLGQQARYLVRLYHYY